MVDSKLLSMVFLEISRVDLDASRILYNKGLYAPAVFHLQQSIEKALKAALLFVGIAPKREEDLNEWLRTTAGHHVTKNLSKIAKCVMAASNLKITEGIHKTLLPFLEETFEAQLAEYRNEMKKFEKLEVSRNEDMEKLLDWVLKSSSDSILNKQYSKAQTRLLKLIMERLPVRSLDFIKQIIIQVSRLSVFKPTAREL
ncbi:MAG: HEPN domain-containing protein [Nitrososphaerota archaeon]|nr:HEPN domain-containing protein [Nitrososphaerota archaeon]